MSGDFRNVYGDDVRARAYDTLDFPGTYALAYRDIPGILRDHVTGFRALDFGCGTGRSTRFLQRLGFHTVGVDIAPEMLERARDRDPEGRYRLVGEGDLGEVAGEAFDLVFCSFTFDNVPHPTRALLFRRLRDLLAPSGRLVNLVSAPAIYRHEWLSFSTEDFPENRTAGDGDPVRIVMLDVEDRRPVEDVFCSDAGYRALYAGAGLRVLLHHSPLGTEEDPHEWVTETAVSPWAIYVLSRTLPGGVGDDIVEGGDAGR